MADVEVGGHRLRLTNLDKDLYRGFTKGAVIDYYARIAETLVPHLADRPLTLRRFPDGVDGDGFFEKEAPSHRPEWVRTFPVPGGRRGIVNYTIVDSPAVIVWLANLAALELHPLLARIPDIETPTCIVFDLDPGTPADILDAAEIALRVRDRLAGIGLEAFAKTSGGKGVHVYVPVNEPVDYDTTKTFAHTVARVLEKDDPGRVTSQMTKADRRARVFVDWSQNDASKTTVAVYSLRAGPQPRVATPVTWDEVSSAITRGDAGALRFSPDDVLRRVERDGDLFAPTLALRQTLPGVPGDAAK
jgi:bifunctional non-homologous end joining protein LigD